MSKLYLLLFCGLMPIQVAISSAAAQNVDIEQLYQHALQLLYGDGLPQDEDSALRELQQIVDQGEPARSDPNNRIFRAANYLMQYITALRESREKKDVATQIVTLEVLGLFFTEAGELHQNWERSAAYVKEAADLGSAQSQLKYAGLLRIGKGVAKDLVEARRYFEMARDNGDELVKRSANRWLGELEKSAKQS
ncbi:MAG: hypothetical protein LBF66_02325 [Holosporales bacterium]|jgi:TPR repeat protein|nr:hypothetical protein [Holosporales bacterium]